MKELLKKDRLTKNQLEIEHSNTPNNSKPVKRKLTV